MFKNLNAGAIGISNKSLAEIIVLAQKSGFAGIDFNIREAAALADKHGLDYVRNLFVENNVVPGQWGLPVDITRISGRPILLNYQSLPPAAWSRAAGARQHGAHGVFWTAVTMPPTADRPHIERFRPIAEIFASMIVASE